MDELFEVGEEKRKRMEVDWVGIDERREGVEVGKNGKVGWMGGEVEVN